MLGVVLLGVVALRNPALGQAFTIDESRWISTSRYFWTTFVERDLSGPPWQPNYIVLTQPPVARYVFGAGLALQGWTPDRLNGRYDISRNREANQRAGNVPGPELLAAARRVAFPFAIGSLVLLFLIGRGVGGPIAGLVAAALAAFNPLLATLWTRALAEAMLAFWMLFGLYAALLVLPSLASGHHQMRHAIGVGVLGALGAATKLTGVLGLAGFAMFGALRQAVGLRRDRRLASICGWLALGCAAVVTWIAVNPLLYPDPVGRSAMMFQHRRDEMRQQAQNAPRLAVPPELSARVELVARRAFGQYGTLGHWSGLPLDGLLAAGGLAAAGLASWRAVRGGGVPDRPALLLCWSATIYAGVTVNLGLDSTHYYAPLVTINTLLGGIGVAAGLSWLVPRV